jgi:hypothetical protein
LSREEDVKKNISDVKKCIQELTKAIEHLDKKKMMYASTTLYIRKHELEESLYHLSEQVEYV